MSGFLADNSTYNITTENQISVILSHFSRDYIFDVIENNIKGRFDFMQNKPNVIASYEAYFKQLSMQYTADLDIQNINQTREDIYIEIIELLSNKFNISLDLTNIQDYYSVAYYLYSFLISDFKNNLVSFFTNYIIREKNAIYEALNLSEYKKNKDTTTLYNKKIYKNIKLAIINANLELVLKNICAFDIDFNTILNCIYQDKNMVKYIQSIMTPNVDFFKEQYVPFIFSNLNPMLTTAIRINIQQQSMIEDIAIQNL